MIINPEKLIPTQSQKQHHSPTFRERETDVTVIIVDINFSIAEIERIMKKQTIIAATLIGSMLLGSNVLAAGGPKSGGAGKSATTATALTSTETNDLQYMRKEEKLARDVYLTMHAQWGDQSGVFSNIAASEETHTSTINYLLAKFNVVDPVINDTIGVFTNQELQALYNDLVEKGKQSFIDALYVGALIEEKDMKDILAAIDSTDERAIIIAYSNLLDGSKSHLRAFVKVIEQQGLEYQAQILDEEEVEMILDDESTVKS